MFEILSFAGLADECDQDEVIDYGTFRSLKKATDVFNKMVAEGNAKVMDPGNHYPVSRGEIVAYAAYARGDEIPNPDNEPPCLLIVSR